MHKVRIRLIEAGDNEVLASIIRSSLAEFRANKPGTVYFDPSTDQLFELFRFPKSIYFVAETDGQVVGGAGLFPSKGLPEDVVELVKMYVANEARGQGIGKQLISTCLHAAVELGYKKIYLETMPELKKALSLYEKLGFTYLDGPMGNTGHFGCDRWMIKDMSKQQEN